MRESLFAVLALGWAVAFLSPLRADDSAALRAVVDKAIRAQGGEAELAKLKTCTVNLKGTIHTQGMDLAFTADFASQGEDQMRLQVDFEVAGQKFKIISVLNRDKGWLKFNEDTIDMDEEHLTEAREEAHANWLTLLVPLKDKSYTLASLGEVMVEDSAAMGIKVSRAGRRDVNLFFDKKTHLLLKTESRVKDEESGQEVTEESFLSGYSDKVPRQAMKFKIKRDGKPYAEGEIVDIKVEEKLDDSVFAKP